MLRTLAGPRWTDSGLICTTEVGTAVNHRNVQRRFRRLCTQAGVPRIRVYDLRHTATSLMIDAGADLKAASEALGHSDPRITMKVYRHVRGDQRAHALALLATAISTPRDPEEPT
jgi:integrase